MQETEYYFDGTEKVFFPVSNKQSYIEAGMWPETGVKVSADMYYIYGGTPPEGKIISADKNGNPVWDDAPLPTSADLIVKAEEEKTRLRSLADAEIVWRQDAVDVGIATDEETAALSEWKKHRVLLMRVNTAKPEWPTPPGEQAS